MATTSLQIMPSLILATQQRDSGRSTSGKTESGRLTPGATSASENKQINLTPAAALKGTLNTDALSASSGYKIAAMQFTLMSRTAFATQVPPELLTIIGSGFLAYHYRSLSLPASIWGKWAAVAGLMTAIFPLTGGFMVPLDHKIARIAGQEPPVEPFEDAPMDREMEKSNTEEFLETGLTGTGTTEALKWLNARMSVDDRQRRLIDIKLTTPIATLQCFVTLEQAAASSISTSATQMTDNISAQP
ncbi:hypothetical protein LTR78_008599 [Recurvomyces mirabilis]|uniref:Uncharacterized protein n=1 Tax=Recurvomyces mirabilis TaxID=574656 RepID=A0AAE0TR02_9PEZI|nr:hypothetical protein LTR78_008599 [Recurvomyces mirabilis]KAK5153489.1 hypothetical protein LTS14_007660 [Recurvomyces mirabilis]